MALKKVSQIGNFETKLLGESSPFKYITKNLKSANKSTSFSSSFNIRGHSVLIEGTKKSKSLNGSFHISPISSRRSSINSINASIPFQASLASGNVNNITFQSVVQSLSNFSRRSFATEANPTNQSNDRSSNNQTNDESSSLMPHISQTALNLLKILIVMVMAIIIMHLIQYFLLQLARVWTFSSFVFFSAIAYCIKLPLFGLTLALVTIGIVPHFPWFVEKKYYEGNFEIDAVAELSKRKDIQEEFGTPIKLTNWNFTDREIVTRDRHTVVMNSKFTIEGTKRRGFVTCTATSKRPSRPWNAHWTFDQVSYSNKPEPAFIDGKRVRSPSQ